MFQQFVICCLIGMSSTTAVVVAADDGKKPTDEAPNKAVLGKVFEKMDGNGDGKVTKEEFSKFRESVMERVKGKLGDKGDRLDTVFDKLFEKLDADKDGVVTKEEFEKAQASGALGRLGDLKGKLGDLKEKFKK